MSTNITVSIRDDQREALKKYGISPSHLIQQTIDEELLKWDEELRQQKQQQLLYQQELINKANLQNEENQKIIQRMEKEKEFNEKNKIILEEYHQVRGTISFIKQGLVLAEKHKLNYFSVKGTKHDCATEEEKLPILIPREEELKNKIKELRINAGLEEATKE